MAAKLRECQSEKEQLRAALWRSSRVISEMEEQAAMVAQFQDADREEIVRLREELDAKEAESETLRREMAAAGRALRPARPVQRGRRLRQQETAELRRWREQMADTFQPSPPRPQPEPEPEPEPGLTGDDLGRDNKN